MPWMQTDPASPRLLSGPHFGAAASAGGELASLENLHAAGIALAPIGMVPAEAEERFYRLNNLPEQIAQLYSGVSLDDPDEDDIEEITPRAQALLRSHYLLDEVIDAFYDVTASLGERLQVRRPGSAGTVVAAGRPGLLAVKRAWEAAWGVDEVLARLRREGTLAPEAAPVLFHAPDAPLTSSALLERVRRVLAGPVEPFGLNDGRVTRVSAVS